MAISSSFSVKIRVLGITIPMTGKIPIRNYCPKCKIIVLNVKLLSAECECESECDGNFYVAT